MAGSGARGVSGTRGIVRSMSGSDALARSWTEFCGRLERLGLEMLDHRDVASDRRSAETLRYLARELRVALESSLEASDADFPRLCRMDESGSGPTAPNVDNWYLTARLRPDAAYLLTGEVGSVFDLNVSVHDAALARVLGERFLGDLDVDEAGGSR